MRKELKVRDYQQQAVNAVLKEFESADRTQLHMAPGSGKTFVAHLIRTQGDYKRVIFACPTIQLVHQSIHAWMKYTNGDIKCAAVCTGAMSQAEQEQLAELSDEKVVVTTNRHKITKLLNESYTVFTTYKSAWVVAEAITRSRKKVDLVIADEAHRTAGR
jgi:predicted helicase